MTEPFRVGVNYWPASSAMRWWRRFDPDEVDRDFARIAAAGGDVVRFFLLWEDFQPEPSSVSDDALQRLLRVADTAERNGLEVIPTLFTGHMSGANFVPEWALGRASKPGRFRVIAGDRVTDREIGNWYSEAVITEAQALLARECARTLSGHPALWGWDMGNENSNCSVPDTKDAGVRWLERMAGAIRGADARCRITVGLHMEDLEQDRRIGPAEVARVSDVLCMHGYPMYASWARGPADPELVAFLAAVTRWLGEMDVLFAEFGAPTKDADAGGAAGEMLLDQDEAARYTERALERLHGEGTVGALAWCYADYARAVWHEPPLDLAPHERHFGLWRADGRAKPAAAALAGWRGRDRMTPPHVDLSREERERFYEAPRDNLVRLYRSAALARPVL
jgi:endo-1,4-beta-mannosidase